MTTLVEKIRQKRRFEVQVDHITFTGSLPTTEQFFVYGRESVTDAEIARKCVDGWRGVTESDLIEDGGDDVIAFDKELFNEVIGDKPEWWRPISDLVIDRFKLRAAEKENKEKNSQSGSKVKASGK